MERGGFHGYRKLPNTNSGTKLFSDISMTLPAAELNHNTTTNSISSSTTSDDNECTVREQDRFMPIANVIRIMRKILPQHAKISDDAKETIQECVSEYISFITAEANERCQREQRKTITAEDVLWAMSKLGFDDYVEPLTVYLHRYREIEGDRIAATGSMSLLIKRAATTASNATGISAMVDYGAFAPAGFHLGHYHQNHNGFLFGGPTGLGLGLGGYLKDGPNNVNVGLSTQPPPPVVAAAAVASGGGEAYDEQHKRMQRTVRS